MQITICGNVGCGKTTIFNLISAQNPKQAMRFSGAEIFKTNCPLPDERLDKLAELFNAPIKYIRFDLYDTPSLEIDQLNQAPHLQLMKNSDLLLYVVDGFSPPEQNLNPDRLRLLAAQIQSEFCLHDYLIVAGRLEKIVNDQKKIHSKELQQEREYLENLKAKLEKNQPLDLSRLFPFQQNLLRGFGLLSNKPIIYLLNCSEELFNKLLPDQQELLDTGFLLLEAKLEKELLELESSERDDFLKELGFEGLQFFSRHYPQLFLKKMDLISFFTVSEDECRAWEIKSGTPALLAAGKIHSDIQRGFIRAEVLDWQEMLTVRSFSKAKEKGLLRIEGRDYVISDGEIVHFRFQV